MPEVTNERLTELCGWDVAEAFGCHYTGDADPIHHGGIFYDARDWEADGYASCVEFWEDPDTEALVVQPGTIRKPDDMEAAFRCIGAEGEDRRSCTSRSRRRERTTGWSRKATATRT
jgi:hypothetical protein